MEHSIEYLEVTPQNDLEEWTHMWIMLQFHEYYKKSLSWEYTDTIKYKVNGNPICSHDFCCFFASDQTTLHIRIPASFQFIERAIQL